MRSKLGIGEVDSWTTAREFAARLLEERGVEETSGWTVAITEDEAMTEIPGLEYVLDLIGERELPPAFPRCTSSSLHSGSRPERRSSAPVPLPGMDAADGAALDETRVPAPAEKSSPARPWKPRPGPREQGETVTGDAWACRGPRRLNNRYFDDKTKARSLDNLSRAAAE
ncbi:Myosin-XV [Penaeus vannamei]|uniref:Myosin-XV n=1 Tax=Penaeus vannamei TaxID=6689 RepID=A0A423SUC1_PENVA|nr:Myosin-XV [Penaeus vannamei]